MTPMTLEEILKGVSPEMFEDEYSDMIAITKGEYNELLNDSDFLNALKAAGVDNWDGYDRAKDILEGWSKE